MTSVRPVITVRIDAMRRFRDSVTAGLGGGGGKGGVPGSASSGGSPFDACGQLASSFSRRRDAFTPTESIYCFDPDPSPSGTGSWAQADHCDHWHLGYNT